VVDVSERGSMRAWEVWPGAAQADQARYLLEKLRNTYHTPILVITRDIGVRAWADEQRLGKPSDDLLREMAEHVLPGG
jgi:hypothetical protein